MSTSFERFSRLFPRSVRLRRTPLIMSVSAVALTLSACSMPLDPISMDEQVSQAREDRTAMFGQQDPVTGPISLEEAMARAVKYNLQQRLGLMEKALQENMVEVSTIDMLPSVAARAGWKTRDNTQASYSQSVSTGDVSLESSTSQEKTTHTTGLEMSWNVLDFGLSYFNAKAQANNVLAAEERRRHVVSSIIEQVRSAYWDAVTAERLEPQVTQALDDARDALDKARQTEQQRLVPPLESLKYQKALLETVRQLEAVEGELAVAKSQLASLMNLPPATDYDLVMPDESALAVPPMTYRLGDLETLSMVRRPEIREQAYKARNAVLEARSSLIKLLPGASLFVGMNTDSNKYLVNGEWADAGMQVSWNLLSLLSWRSTERVGDAKIAVEEMRRQALRMAVLTQVNVAYHRYEKARNIFDRSQDLNSVQQRILAQTRYAERSDAQIGLERIRVEAESVLAARAQGRSYSDLQSAIGAIYQAAGLDPLPDNMPRDITLSQLTQAIATARVALDSGDAASTDLALAKMPGDSKQPDVTTDDPTDQQDPLQTTDTSPDSTDIPDEETATQVAISRPERVWTDRWWDTAPPEDTVF